MFGSARPLEHKKIINQDEIKQIWKFFFVFGDISFRIAVY